MVTTRIADGVWRCGTAQINWYLLEEDGQVTLVDAGLPGYRPQLASALAQLGRTIDDVAAVVLTHGHPDHVGFAETLRVQAGVPVFVHKADAELATTQKMPRRERSFVRYLGRRRAWPAFAHMVRNGRPRSVREVVTFDDGVRLDLPGHPQVLHMPGHTAGSCALNICTVGVLLVGDALCGRNPFAARSGPQIMPAAFNVSSQQALDSLSRIGDVDAAVVGFGHGDPWTGGVPAAIESAQAMGPS